MNPDVLVNVGCGDKPLPGFVNLDLDRDADLYTDVRKGLPFGDGTVDGIYSEHFVEHLDQAELMRFLRECRRVLRPGGLVRAATPDLHELVRTYLDPDWKVRSGLEAYGYDWLANPCEMLNLCLREWGHKHVLDAVEFERLAVLAGLDCEGVRPHGRSGYAPFNERETRTGSHLIMEFRKPSHEPAPDEPLVSVLIPAYTPRWFEEALLSTRRQTHTRLEILVGDDSSSGEIAAIAQRHAAEDPRVRYRCNPGPLGEIRNYQQLLERARGDYVKPLADDDLLEPCCIERLVDVLERHPGVSLASSYRRLIDEDGAFLPDDFNVPLAEGDVRLDGVEAASVMLGGGRNYVGEPTCALFRRADVRALQPLMMSFGGRRVTTNADVALWLNLLSRGDLVLLAEPLSRFRQHAAQFSQSGPHHAAALECWEMLRQDARRLGLWTGTRSDAAPPAVLPLTPVADAAPAVSLLLAVSGELPRLLAGSERLALEQLSRSLEFVVIDAGLAPVARCYFERMAKHTSGVRMLPGVDDSHLAALARGGAAARGDLLVVADLQALPPLGWLAAVVEPLAADPSRKAVIDTEGHLRAVRRDQFESVLAMHST
jgi:predicted SAM-dependent methyltransferase